MYRPTPSTSPAAAPPPFEDVHAPLSALQLQKYIDACAEWLTDGDDGDGGDEAIARVPATARRRETACVLCGRPTHAVAVVNPFGATGTEPMCASCDWSPRSAGHAAA